MFQEFMIARIINMVLCGPFISPFEIIPCLIIFLLFIQVLLIKARLIVILKNIFRFSYILKFLFFKCKIN